MPCGLPDDLADLDLRLDVREIGDVAQELLAVLAHPLLEVGERIEVDVADRHVRRGSAGRAAAEALAIFRLTASCGRRRRVSAACGEYRPSGPQKPGDVIAGAFVEKCRSDRNRRSSCFPDGSETRV